MILPLLLVALAGVAPAAAPVAAPAGSPASSLHVGLRRALEVERPDVTAAYPVDDELVSAAVVGGRVRVYGVRPGTTQVVLVTAGGIETIPVTVDAPPQRVAASGGAAGSRSGSSFQAGFDSQTDRLAVDFDSVARSASRTLRFRVSSATGTGRDAGRESGTALPWLAFTAESRGRRLTVGDERARVSPLTLSGTSLRGLHWSSGRLLLHAGWSSATLYEDLLLPSERESAAGASYRLSRGSSTLMPSLYVYPSDSPYGGARGAFGSLLYGFGAPGDRLHGEAEIGYGGRSVAAGALVYSGPAAQGRIAARYQPSGSASLGLGRPHGAFLAGDGSSRIGAGLSLAASFTVDHNESESFEHRSEAASAELRSELGRHLRLRGGARIGTFAPTGEAPTARTLTLPFEVAWSGKHGSLAALYRHERHSADSGGGDGGRLNGNLRFSRLRASAYVEWQPSAVSLDLVLGAEPGLARALAELGLGARTPDDLARLLRENAVLVDLGYFDPTSVRFDAVRRQAGFDLDWALGRRQRLAARVLLDRTSLGDAVRTTRVGSLGYSHELAGFELFGSVSFYARGGRLSDAEPSFRVGLRRAFDRLPGLPRSGRALEGYVYRDDEAVGRPTPASARGVAGAEVRLDDGRFMLTDASGRFRFEGAGRGPRRVELALPAGAYFTTPSAIEVGVGREAAFGVGFAPARLFGAVRDEAGNGMAGVRLRLTAGEAIEHGSTDSLGGFAFSMAPGDYALAVEPDSLPPGFAQPERPVRPVRLGREAPAREEFVLTAQRSLSGRVAATRTPEARVCLLEDARCVTPDADGRYVFRGVRAGSHTVVAAEGMRTASRTVVAPAAPGAVGGVDLALP